MECMNKKCSIVNDDERMLACWLCNGLIHFKCGGIPVLAAEAIYKCNGVNWCCTHCRKIGVDFYKFFQARKSTFLDIKKEILNLSDRLSNYEKLFDEFSSLDNYKSPEKSSPKRRKSARNNNKALNDQCSAPSTSNNNNNINNAIVTPLSTPSVSVNVSNKTTQIEQNNQISQTSETSIDPNNQTSDVINNAESMPRELRVIPPKKSVFVSRFASDTTSDDMEYYLKLPSSTGIIIHKFSYSEPRSIASFKITVPNDIFDRVVDPCFWPNNALVREFLYRENRKTNNVARLSSNESTNQKNFA